MCCFYPVSGLQEEGVHVVQSRARPDGDRGVVVQRPGFRVGVRRGSQSADVQVPRTKGQCCGQSGVNHRLDPLPFSHPSNAILTVGCIIEKG